MGQILFSGGNGGLVSSDELTANTNYVLDGKTYMGIDTDDEAGTGSMPNIASVDYGPSLAVNGDDLFCRMTNGAHIENAASGYPEVAYSLDKVRQAINYTDAAKVLNDTTICGLTGTMPNQGTWNSSVGVNSSIAIPRGYHSGDGKVSNSVATMGAQTITPSHSQQTISCSGKYMTGNITINGTNIFRQYVGTTYASGSKLTFYMKKWGGTNYSRSLYYCDVYPSGFNHISAITWHGGASTGACGYMFDQSTTSGYYWGNVEGGSSLTWNSNNGGAYIFTNTHIRFPSCGAGYQSWFWIYGY